ncbi:SemiSWEET transporter [uncultured Ferrovibrio sp.]|jgi:MtN3 and saliva related transmembrane protein|uniref:SemiSWEET transporter n=1 Tax=uncultured Ferrovibrio sp. TaxID=1576913 RepID=UPI0026164C7C|nr:SemiSWEET transporter [uncultured Ferrovibrio sp.]
MPSHLAIEALGIAAGCLTTLAYVPQVVKVWRRRSARDISLGMFLLMNAGIALWLVYGLLIGSLGLIIANLVTLGLTATVLVAKLKFDRAASTLDPLA